jgi:hypothetical protein
VEPRLILIFDRESDDKFVGKQAEIEAGMQDSLQSIQASYADDRVRICFVVMF